MKIGLPSVIANLLERKSGFKELYNFLSENYWDDHYDAFIFTFNDITSVKEKNGVRLPSEQFHGILTKVGNKFMISFFDTPYLMSNPRLQGSPNFVYFPIDPQTKEPITNFNNTGGMLIDEDGVITGTYMITEEGKQIKGKLNPVILSSLKWAEQKLQKVPKTKNSERDRQNRLSATWMQVEHYNSSDKPNTNDAKLIENKA